LSGTSNTLLRGTATYQLLARRLAVGPGGMCEPRRSRSSAVGDGVARFSAVGRPRASRTSFRRQLPDAHRAARRRRARCPSRVTSRPGGRQAGVGRGRTGTMLYAFNPPATTVAPDEWGRGARRPVGGIGLRRPPDVAQGARAPRRVDRGARRPRPSLALAETGRGRRRQPSTTPIPTSDLEGRAVAPEGYGWGGGADLVVDPVGGPRFGAHAAGN